MTRAKSNAKNAASGRPSPAPAVTSQLEAIDTSPLEELVETRAEQVKVSDYLEKAEKRRDKVAERVWTEVVDDYRERARTLSDAAAPLEHRVRVEFARLRELRETIEQAVADARFEKDEAEFRHELGELSDDELKSRLTGPKKRIGQGEADLAAVDELKARFVDAFDSEEDLALPDADDGLPPPDVTHVPSEATRETPAARPEPEDGTPAELLETQPPSATRVINPDDLVKKDDEPAPAEAPAATDQDDEDEDDGRTFLLPAAALLVTTDGEDSATEYRLASLNYIGRAEENQLRMAQPGVSRKHALVCATDRGYMIQDLESQNGTFVNGSRISEHTLADGDEIAIGNVQLVFRTPWPEPSGAKRDG